MTTLNDVVEITYRRAMSAMREEQDTLLNSVSANATSVQVSGTLGSIAPSGIIQIDYELFLVQATTNTTNPILTVVPAYLDSTSTAHTAGAIITVNPRFPSVDIIHAVNETLNDLSSPANGLFQALTIAPTFNPVTIGYDFYDPNASFNPNPDLVIDVISARVHEYGPYNKYPLIPGHLLRLNRNADPAVFPNSAANSTSGYGLALEFMGNGFPGRPIRVNYKYPYNATLANATDDIQSVTGLHPQAHDLLPLGAIYRLFIQRELKRSFSEAQGEPRRAQEVPPGSALNAVKLIKQELDDRTAAERIRLERMYRVEMR